MPHASHSVLLGVFWLDDDERPGLRYAESARARAEPFGCRSATVPAERCEKLKIPGHPDQGLLLIAPKRCDSPRVKGVLVMIIEFRRESNTEKRPWRLKNRVHCTPTLAQHRRPTNENLLSSRRPAAFAPPRSVRP